MEILVWIPIHVYKQEAVENINYNSIYGIL